MRQRQEANNDMQVKQVHIALASDGECIYIIIIKISSSS